MIAYICLTLIAIGCAIILRYTKAHDRDLIVDDTYAVSDSQTGETSHRAETNSRKAINSRKAEETEE